MKPIFSIEKNEVFEDTKYNKRVSIPQYLPTKNKPILEELYDITHYAKLIRDINLSTVSEEEKKFLKFAASRHIVFNYSKVADYYAHATPEMQRLMENSALVIIDPEDAIANGYVKLSKNIEKLLDESKEIINE